MEGGGLRDSSAQGSSPDDDLNSVSSVGGLLQGRHVLWTYGMTHVTAVEGLRHEQGVLSKQGQQCCDLNMWHD